MLQLQTESYYRCLLFASSDYPDATKRPKLEVCYSLVNAVTNLNNSDNLRFEVSPNPSNGIVRLNVDQQLKNSFLQIYNSVGQLVRTEKINDITNEYQLTFGAGIYFATINSGTFNLSRKIIIY